MTSRLWFKITFVLGCITTKHKYIINTQVMKINKCILSFINAEPPTDEMRNGINIVFVHYRRTNSFCSGPLTYNHLVKSVISLFLEYMLTSMVSNVYK